MTNKRHDLRGPPLNLGVLTCQVMESLRWQYVFKMKMQLSRSMLSRLPRRISRVWVWVYTLERLLHLLPLGLLGLRYSNWAKPLLWAKFPVELVAQFPENQSLESLGVILMEKNAFADDVPAADRMKLIGTNRRALCRILLWSSSHRSWSSGHTGCEEYQSL